MPQPHPTQSKRPSGSPRTGARKASSELRLEERTREDLYALARELGIPGFSEMTKAELVEAIRRR
jgi:hypothetical protein